MNSLTPGAAPPSRKDPLELALAAARALAGSPTVDDGPLAALVAATRSHTNARAAALWRRDPQ